MTSRLVAFLMSLIVFSCASHDLDPTSPENALLMARSMCDKDATDMQWFNALLEAGETDFGQRGDIYAIELDGKVVFVHQPMILSCVACRLYSCDGDIIQLTIDNHEKVREGMNSATKIYAAF